VHFVNYVNLVAAGSSGKFYVLPQLADLVYPPVGGAVYFPDIDGVSVRYFTAVDTFIAGRRNRPGYAVKGLRQYPGNGCLAHPARPAEEKGMGNAPLGNRILQRPYDVLLTRYLFKFLGTALSCQNAVFLHKRSCEKMDENRDSRAYPQHTPVTAAAASFRT